MEPKWNQTFIYAPMKRSSLKSESLQMTVYDYDRIGSGEYVGEVRTNSCYVELCYPDDVSHCRILSPDKTEWRFISATLCG